MLLSDLAKKEVLDAKANHVGTIIDANVDVSDGKVTNFVLRTSLTKKISLLSDQIDKVGEKVMLKVNKEDIEPHRVRSGRI